MIKIALFAILVMPSSYCIAAEGNCDGTKSANCHPPTSNGPYTFCGSGGCFDNCTKNSGSGDNSINICNSGTAGTCAVAGTVACRFTTTFTTPSGDVVFSGPDSSNPDTYTCY